MVGLRKVVFGGGCFWGVEEYYRRLKGVIATRVGYAQGDKERPSYEDVRTQQTHHREVVEIIYDPQLITLSQMMDHLFRIIDPTMRHRQGHDIGESYQSGMYYENEEDREAMATFVLERQGEYAVPLAVEVDKLKKFWLAETYHQEYLVKNPTGYCHVDFSKMKPEERKGRE